jgi:serine/threonine protein kinase/tetratricopeptide (TPR) repeat protein
MALPIGEILDRKFKIVQVLGEGGMGTVYKVELLDRPGNYCAVKELLISPSTSEEERKSAIERFNKEIDLLFGLKHPRIPSFMLSFQERGNYYFVMEFVPGQSLDRKLEENKGPLNEEDVIKWMMQVCEALSYIHSRNPPIILRDLKPGNVMLTNSGDVQLIDFGIARRFDPNKRTNTENLGTISYASPEHLGSITDRGQRRSAQNPGKLVQTDARSDIYSLGATMYHLLTNYEPDPIQTPATGSILAKNPRLRTVRVNNTVVCPIEQVIIKAMQQSPAQRFQSAEAMRTALQHCLPNYAPPTTVQIPAVSSSNATILVQSNGLICPKCGFQNRPGAKFCKCDGQPLLQGATAVPPQPRVPVPARQPIQSRPIQARPLQPRPVVSQPIRARPVAVSAPPAGDPVAAYRLGLQYLNSKNYAESVNQFKLALARNKPSYDVLYNLGRAYRQYGQASRGKDTKLFTDNMRLAAEQFEEAIRLKSNALDALFQLGMCYRDMDLYSQSMATFKKAQQLAPGDPAIYYQLGMVAVEQGSRREAEKYFLDGLKITPDHALILTSLGHLYVELDQTRSAIDILLQATQREPNLPDGWYELGRAYMKTRDWKSALKALEKARQLNPDASSTYSAMATCYQKINKRNEAKQKTKEALLLDPNNSEAIRLQRQL